MAPAKPVKRQVTAADVRQVAERLIPSAKLGLAPSTASLVNIQTIMWVVAPSPQALRPVRILGQPVRITIAIDHVAWNFGDGQSASSDGPGKAYDATNDPCRSEQCPDYFGHTYRSTGSMNVSATVSWTAKFSVAGGPAVAIPGVIAGPAAAKALQIKEAAGVLVPDQGH